METTERDGDVIVAPALEPSESVQSTKATASAWPRLNVYGPPTTSLTWIAADAGVALATNIATIKSALPKKRQRAITDSF